jgi:hypothetical protein
VGRLRQLFVMAQACKQVDIRMRNMKIDSQALSVSLCQTCNKEKQTRYIMQLSYCLSALPIDLNIMTMLLSSQTFSNFVLRLMSVISNPDTRDGFSLCSLYRRRSRLHHFLVLRLPLF